MMRLNLVCFLLLVDVLCGCTPAVWSGRGCVLETAPARECCTLTNAIDDVWLSFGDNQVEYGYVGDPQAELSLRHLSCGESRCLFADRRRAKGTYYIRQDGQGGFDLGRVDDINAFPVLRFKRR